MDDLPIRPRLTMISVASAGAALLLACGAFVAYEALTSRTAVVRDLEVQAEMLGRLSTSALLSHDPESATATLRALNADPRVVSAQIYSTDGRLFASYARKGSGRTTAPPAVSPGQTEGPTFSLGRVVLSHRFEFDKAPIGIVVVEADLSETRTRLQRYGLIALFMLLASSALAYWAASRLQRAVEEQSRRVQEATRLKSEFLANMSHELRTPLNAIIGFAELMHDAKVGPVSPQHKECLDDILTSSRHLLQLINDVLDVSKVEAGRMEFHPEPVDVGTVVGEVTDILRSLSDRKRITVTVDVDPGLGEVVVDPGKLKQVLYNYLSNAIKFTPDRGEVMVRAIDDGPETFRLEVDDTGIGIQPEDLHRLFVEFQQLDASAAKAHPGTGLGLALTRRIVEAQGGRVGVESTPGGGSLFFATLPRTTHGR